VLLRVSRHGGGRHAVRREVRRRRGKLHVWMQLLRVVRMMAVMVVVVVVVGRAARRGARLGTTVGWV
jgi:hypothetical protein